MANPFAPVVDNLSQGSGLRAKAFARAARHSRRVALLKFALPVSAFVILGVLGFFAIQARLGSEVEVAGVALEGDRIVMDQPRLNGVTSANEPYTVEARRALQLVTDVNDLNLEDIKAQIPFGAGVTAEVLAPNGHLNNASQVLVLRGGFSLTSSDGMVAKLKDAEIDFEGKSLKTEMPVDIKRPGTHIQADSLVITDGGAKLVFEKRVRMTLQPGAMEQPKEPNNGG